MADKNIWNLFSKGKLEEVKVYLEEHPKFDVNSNITTLRSRPLSVACFAENIPIIQLLLAHPDINVNQKDDGGYNPFLFACSVAKIEVVKILLKDSRVDINITDDYGRSPLWDASWDGHVDVIKWMIASGREIDLDIKGVWNGEEYTAIDIARRYNNTEVVSLLERFTENQAQTRHEIRVELGLVDKDAADVYSTVVFLCDGLLSLKLTPENEKEERAKQFFAITMKVPLELQMNISGKAASSSKEYIPQRMSEPAFKHLAKMYAENN